MGSAAAELTTGLMSASRVAWRGRRILLTPPGTEDAIHYYCYPTYYNAVTYDLGYSAGAKLGYSFGGPRVEFEYNYRNNGADTIATAGERSLRPEVDLEWYMVNVLYDFDTGSKWIPYIGEGIGMADVKANNIHSADLTQPAAPRRRGQQVRRAVHFRGGIRGLGQVRYYTRLARPVGEQHHFNYGIGCTAGGLALACKPAYQVRLLERRGQPRSPLQVLSITCAMSRQLVAIASADLV